MTNVDTIRSLIDTRYSEVYALAANAGSSTAMTISNMLALPETVSNWPLYAYLMVAKTERLLYLDLEWSDIVEPVKTRSIQLIWLLMQVARYVSVTPVDKTHIFIQRLIVIISMAASFINYPTALSHLQTACQALVTQVGSEDLQCVSLNVYDG